jgi:BASS family bile acid:Na+ symporter
MTHPVDQMQINFNDSNMIILKIILALVMLGVSLDIRKEDLQQIPKHPKSVIAGVLGQFLLLPAFTFLLVYFFKPIPSIGLGMMLVAACPGGNLSNLFTMFALGNTALSVSLTFLATVGALVMTPFNITFWGSMYEPTAQLVKQVALDPKEVMITVIFVLGIPLLLGLVIRAQLPKVAVKLQGWLKYLSALFLCVLIVGAFAANFDNFIKYFDYVVAIVVVHNIVALASGFIMGLVFRVPYRDRRSITIEVGIQNSGLGLALAFEFFNGLGGVTLICAFWGLWHIVSGSIVATIFARFDKKAKLTQGDAATT